MDATTLKKATMQKSEPTHILRRKGADLVLSHVCDLVGCTASLKIAGIDRTIEPDGSVVVHQSNLDSVIAALGFDRYPYEIELRGNDVFIRIMETQPNPFGSTVMPKEDGWHIQ
jgi:hypothetical protein